MWLCRVTSLVYELLHSYTVDIGEYEECPYVHWGEGKSLVVLEDEQILWLCEKQIFCWVVFSPHSSLNTMHVNGDI